MSQRLYIFDLDGTLAKTWEATVLSGVVDRVSALKGHLAVATNQAGVGWHAVEGEPYPQPIEVGQRLVEVADAAEAAGVDFVEADRYFGRIQGEAAVDRTGRRVSLEDVQEARCDAPARCVAPGRVVDAIGAV